MQTACSGERCERYYTSRKTKARGEKGKIVKEEAYIATEQCDAGLSRNKKAEPCAHSAPRKTVSEFA